DSNHGIKLSDFGLTRRTDQSWTGELMGTPAYVAPEIMDPKATVGAPADIFAVGVIMYRMITGRLPFPGLGNDQQVLYHNINSEIPSVTRTAPSISPDIAGIISWCTRRAVKDRPQDATELFRALCETKARLSSTELAYRAEIAQTPATTLWQDVTAIAEKSGMTKVYRSTPISGFGSADDLLHEDDEAQLTEHEQSVLAAVENDGEVYAPTQISGVGPLTKHQAAVEGSTDETLFWDVADSPNATTAFPAQQVQENPAHATEEQRGNSQVPYGSISGSYNPGRALSNNPQRSQPHSALGSRQRDRQQWDEALRRRPPQPWLQPPTPVALVMLFLLLLLGFVAAGFVGWWLAGLLL
ncbi:MAG: protein kinase, partial [Rothia sp. (in: high G+C Gram-positive bacteria)]|nr:protein kinase [Rothia sp. (in: high G+C Gram-positive bacteria)]